MGVKQFLTISSKYSILFLKLCLFSSVHTQLPFDYYSLKFCKPPGGVKPYSENLGEFLRGDRIENSAYEVCKLTMIII